MYEAGKTLAVFMRGSGGQSELSAGCELQPEPAEQQLANLTGVQSEAMLSTGNTEMFAR